MKTKFQISIIILGIIVAFFCLLALNPVKIPTYNDGHLSYRDEIEDTFVFKTLPEINFNLNK